MTMYELYAQGDLLIERLADTAPSGTIIPASPEGEIVVAEGELTGHRHVIYENAVMFRDDGLARDIPGSLCTHP